MKALNLVSLGNFELEERERPIPKKGEVLIQVKAAGICGSDIPRAFINGPYHYPTVLGHEFSGEIVAIGEGVESELIGRKAAVFPLVPCNECVYCDHHLYAQCSNYSYFGSRQDGGFQEYLNVPVFNLVLLKDNVKYEEAAMIEPLTVAQHVINKAELKVGDIIVIYGAGPIGLLIARWAKMHGSSKIIIIDIDEEKVNFAKKIGFENAINGSKINPINWIIQNTNGLGADIVIEGTGSSISFINCLESIRVGGKIVLLGNPHGDYEISMKTYDKFMRKEGKIIGIFNSVYSDFPRNEWQVSADMLSNKVIKVDDLITHKVGIQQLGKMFEIIYKKQEFYCKAMMVNDI